MSAPKDTLLDLAREVACWTREDARMDDTTPTDEMIVNRRTAGHRLLRRAKETETARLGLLSALHGLEDAVGMACVERNTPCIGKVSPAQWSRVEAALTVARRALENA